MRHLVKRGASGAVREDRTPDLTLTKGDALSKYLFIFKYLLDYL